LTAGLAVATFVKAFGIGFLARPRSPEAAHAIALELLGLARLRGSRSASGLADAVRHEARTPPRAGSFEPPLDFQHFGRHEAQGGAN